MFVGQNGEYSDGLVHVDRNTYIPFFLPVRARIFIDDDAKSTS
jgi:hypothetical protein